MWRLGILLAAASMTLLPRVARATVYTFDDTETSALSPLPVNFTFSLDTTTAISSGSSTTFTNVVIDENGTPLSGNSVQAAYGTDLGSPLFFLIDTSLPPFYTGSGTGIVFNTGTFAIADGATDGEGRLEISTSGVTPTPEPASWALLLTGGAIAAAGRCFSRRLRTSGRVLA